MLTQNMKLCSPLDDPIIYCFKFSVFYYESKILGLRINFSYYELIFFLVQSFSIHISLRFIPVLKVEYFITRSYISSFLVKKSLYR